MSQRKHGYVKVIHKEIRRIQDVLDKDPTTYLPSIHVIATELESKTGKKVYASRLQVLLKKALGPDLYSRKFKPKKIDPSAVKTLDDEVVKVKEILTRNSANAVPSLNTIAKTIEFKTGKTASLSTISTRLKKTLGEELYALKYKVPELSEKVEVVVERELNLVQEILNQDPSKPVTPIRAIIGVPQPFTRVNPRPREDGRHRGTIGGNPRQYPGFRRGAQ